MPAPVLYFLKNHKDMKKQLQLALICAIAAFSLQAQDYIISLGTNAFTPPSLTIDLGETVQWQNTAGGFHNVNGDQATFPGNPASFFSGAPVGGNWTFNHTFTVPGVYDFRCDIHFGSGMIGQITVVDPTSYPVYDIGLVTTSDADGVCDSIGTVCQLEGVVYGIDFRGGNGVQFVMRDATGGIVVFSTSANYYTVTEGDQIIVRGTIGQFNGLNQINPDTILFVSAGNTLEDPELVTELNESTEAKLVRINQVWLVSPAQWTNSGAGFNIDLTDGTNAYSMRIDNDCNIFGTPAPVDTFDVIGLGYQFDNSLPYTSGYQFYPRYQQDIIGSMPPPPQYPAYDIAVVTTVDANGQPDSLDVKCQLQGIVTTGDLNGGNPVQFFLQDATGGLSVFSGNSFGYTVQPGDEVIIRGAIAQFSCLSQIAPDTLWLVSSGNNLPAPALVTGPLTEAHEGELIQINNLIVSNPSQWTGAGAGFSVDVTDGVNTYVMRIDNDVDLYSLPAPVGTFNAIGVGSQFDTAPCDGGYQFLPRSLEDIISTSVDEVYANINISLYPNPAGDLLVVRTDIPVERWIVSDLQGRRLLEWSNTQAHAYDVSTLQPGMYLLQGVVEGRFVSRKFVKGL